MPFSLEEDDDERGGGVTPSPVALERDTLRDERMEEEEEKEDDDEEEEEEDDPYWRGEPRSKLVRGLDSPLLLFDRSVFRIDVRSESMVVEDSLRPTRWRSGGGSRPKRGDEEEEEWLLLMLFLRCPGGRSPRSRDINVRQMNNEMKPPEATA